MDKQNKLVLDKDGIIIAHSLRRSFHAFNAYVPLPKSLILCKSTVCDYCTTNTAHTQCIQLYLNTGVQICEACILKHSHHVTFLQNTIKNKELSWWQFKSLFNLNTFIHALSPFNSYKYVVPPIKIESKMINVSKTILIRKGPDNTYTLLFPMFDYNSNTPWKYIPLEEFCQLNLTLSRTAIMKTVIKYCKGT